MKSLLVRLLLRPQLPSLPRLVRVGVLEWNRRLVNHAVLLLCYFAMRCYYYVPMQCYNAALNDCVLNAVSFEWVCWSFGQEALSSEVRERSEGRLAQSRVREPDSERADSSRPASSSRLHVATSP